MRIERIRFIPGQQAKFLAEVYLKSKLSTEQLSKMINRNPRSFRDWKNEKLTMTLSAAEFFCEEYGIILPEKKGILVNRWLAGQRRANRGGGVARFEKYGSPATEDGRRKGGIAAIRNLRRNGYYPKLKIYKLPIGYSNSLAELVGILLGDGGITHGQVTITLNSEKDLKYSKYVSDLGMSLFGERPKEFKRKNERTLILYYNGNYLVRFLVSIGLVVGNKVKQQVGVPKWILDSNEFSKACLRGLMDTDGGVFVHSYNVNGKKYSYKKISFTNKSIPLLYFVKRALEHLGFNPKIIYKVENKKVWLYNMQEVHIYMRVVGSSNSRLLDVIGG